MPANPAPITVAQSLLQQLGVTLTDLQNAATTTTPMPTLYDYLPHVRAAAGPGANRTYSSYWTVMAHLWGD